MSEESAAPSAPFPFTVEMGQARITIIRTDHEGRPMVLPEDGEDEAERLDSPTDWSTLFILCRRCLDKWHYGWWDGRTFLCCHMGQGEPRGPGFAVLARGLKALDEAEAPGPPTAEAPAYDPRVTAPGLHAWVCPTCLRCYGPTVRDCWACGPPVDTADLVAACALALKLIDPPDAPDSGASELVVLVRQRLRTALANAEKRAHSGAAAGEGGMRVNPGQTARDKPGPALPSTPETAAPSISRPMKPTKTLAEVIMSMPFLTPEGQRELLLLHFQEINAIRPQGGTLTADGYIELWHEVVDDLGLKPGEAVLFRKNASGRWEAWNEEEVAKEWNDGDGAAAGDKRNLPGNITGGEEAFQPETGVRNPATAAPPLSEGEPDERNEVSIIALYALGAALRGDPTEVGGKQLRDKIETVASVLKGTTPPNLYALLSELGVCYDPGNYPSAGHWGNWETEVEEEDCKVHRKALLAISDARKAHILPAQPPEPGTAGTAQTATAPPPSPERGETCL